MTLFYYRLNSTVVGCCLAALVFWSALATAEVPETINYQGVLNNGSGSPINGPVNLTFKMYLAVTGGSAIWTEAHTGVNVSGGAFSVQLGSVTPFRNQSDGSESVSNSDNLLFNVPYYLGITVNTDPEMSPRLKLSTAPYAFSGPGLTETIVDCTSTPEESIQAVIDADAPYSAAMGSILVININGVCEQNVEIKRNRVILRGVNLNDGGAVEDPPTNGIIGQVDSKAAVRVNGALGVAVLNLLVQSKPGLTTDYYGVQVRANGAVYIGDSKFSDSLRAVFANDGGFAQVERSELTASEYAVLLADGGNGKIKDSDLTISNSSSFATIGAYRSTNAHIQGTTSIVNKGNDGIAGNADDGDAINMAHGAQLRQDSGHATFTGHVVMANQSLASLRDPSVTGDLEASNSTRIELRASSTEAAELNAGKVVASKSSQIDFVRDDMSITVSGNVEANGNSQVTFGRENMQISIGGNLRANQNSLIAIWRQTPTVSVASIDVSQSSQAYLRGTVTVTGNVNVNNYSTLDVFDADSTSTTNKTVVSVGGDLQANNSRVQVGGTAKVNVTGVAGFDSKAMVSVDGVYVDPPGCDDDGSTTPCTTDNYSQLSVGAANGIYVGDANLSISNGAVVSAKNLGVGPFTRVALSGASDLEIETAPGTPSSISMHNYNVVFWNGGTAVVGNIEASGTTINISDDGAEHFGNITLYDGASLNLFNDLTVENGSITCSGGSLNLNGNAVTYVGTGSTLPGC